MNRGVIYAVSAYVFWGIHPIYWKMLKSVPAVEIVSHRIVWSFLFYAIILFARSDWKTLIGKIRSSQNKNIIFAPALMIGSNWALYIWAVNAGYIVETSLGYFICPLISVFLGVVFLKESLRIIQWFSIFVAAGGVMVMTFVYGRFPWISLYLAATWACYGLFRKKSPLNSVEGLAVETALMSVPALFYLGYHFAFNIGNFGNSLQNSVLLAGSGLISGFPLIIFIAGARQIKLSLIGILQYIYPTLLLIVGTCLYHESITESKLTGFVCVWLAIIIYSLESTYHLRKKRNNIKLASSFDK